MAISEQYENKFLQKESSFPILLFYL